MTQARGYVYTDLSQQGALTLHIEGQDYEVTQFASSWAVNEIPTAVCALSVGRNVRTGLPAGIHTSPSFRHMAPATVTFSPSGQFSETKDWPEGPRVIFDGFFLGFTYRKINGKINAIANLYHWLLALTFSSALTRTGHPANPTQMNVAAILPSLSGLGAASGGAYLSHQIGHNDIVTRIGTDFWGAIKGNFCRLANRSLMPGVPNDICLGSGPPGTNTAALAALSRIEGPTPGTVCGLPYQWGVPLQFSDDAFGTVVDSITDAILTETVESYAGTSFWDKLVGRYCPQFGLALVPMIDTAILIADTPLLTGTPFPYWKEIELDDYDATDGTDELHRPLRGVGVIAGYFSQTNAGEGPPGSAIIGGCYVEDSVSPGDGIYQYVPAPPWLEGRFSAANLAGITTFMQAGAAQPTATTPAIGAAVPAPGGGTFPSGLRTVFNRYANMVYANHVLRGRTKTLSGKLRFDIAPGSLLRVNPAAEKFLGAEDSLATVDYAAVSRVTITINAESAMAGTTFNMTHRRTEQENAEPRTSIRGHPLFGTSIHGGGKHGCPLKDDYNLG